MRLGSLFGGKARSGAENRASGPGEGRADPNFVAHDEPSDALLKCLEFIVRYHDRPISGDLLTAGLPLIDGRLTPSLFVRAAERAGFAARLIARPLSRVSPLVLPAILIMNDGAACILMSYSGRRKADVVLPDAGSGIAKVDLKQLKARYSGYCILVKPEFQFDGRASELRPERSRHWFWGTLARLWPTYIQVMIAAAIVNLLALASPLFIMNVYDRVLPNQAIATLWVLAIGIGLAIGFDFMLRMVRGSLIDAAGRRTDVILASRIFEQVMNMRLYNRPATTGSFVNKLKEFEIVREFFTSSTVATLTDLLFIGIFLIVIHQIAGALVWIPAIAVIVTVVVGLIMQWPLNRAMKETMRESSYRHSLLVEAISSLETIKAARAESHMQRLWERFVGRTSETSEKVRFLSSIGTNFTTFVQQLVSVAIIIGGVYLFSEGDISMGAIIATVILAGRAVSPLAQVALTIARCQHAVVALGSLNEIMKLPVDRPDDTRFVNRRVEKGDIECRGASFSYPGSNVPALRDFSVRIKAGERVGIIGRIGSGKTTVGRILSGLQTADGGAVLVDGVDIRQYNPYEIRRAVAFVIQEADLFYGSVRDNIAMGAPYADDDTIINAAKIAGVDDFVSLHPSGYDLQVGERGQFLSGGQRQAIALARALLFQPPVVFLDEPSGAMDNMTEQRFIERLQSAMKPEQTLIVSTHRFSMLALVDRLVVLDNGQVVADGPKDKVLEKLAQQKKAASPAVAPPADPPRRRPRIAPMPPAGGRSRRPA